MLEPLLIGACGKITIPEALRSRHGFEPNTPFCVIETQSDILLVPLTDAPMSEGLKAELVEWQSLGAEAPCDVPLRGEGVSACCPSHRFDRSSHLSA